MLRHPTRPLALVCAYGLVLGCTDAGNHPTAATKNLQAFSVTSGEPGAASDRRLYQVRFAPQGDSHVEGVALIEIVGGYLAVTVHASGHQPLRSIPQHIHLNPTCNPGGGILLNLDANLTVPGEGPSVGSAYPVSNEGGAVNYYASRTLTDLLAAVNTYLGANLASVDALLTWLNLDQRNVHMHVPDAPFTPVTCGGIDRLN
jgi:hypothetical protein